MEAKGSQEPCQRISSGRCAPFQSRGREELRPDYVGRAEVWAGVRNLALGAEGETMIPGSWQQLPPPREITIRVPSPLLHTPPALWGSWRHGVWSRPRLLVFRVSHVAEVALGPPSAPHAPPPSLVPSGSHCKLTTEARPSPPSHTPWGLLQSEARSRALCPVLRQSSGWAPGVAGGQVPQDGWPETLGLHL